MDSDIPWVEKYRPKSLSQMILPDEVSNKIVSFLKSFPDVSHKALLLIGPPGIGKTTIVYAIANDLKYNVYEINASDSRRKDDLEKVKITSKVSALDFFTKRSVNKIIFIDEVDGIGGNEERGGLTTIMKIINDSSFPVIMAANFENDRMKKLEEVSDVIRFPKPSKKELVAQMKRILDAEHIPYEEEAVIALAKKSEGDYRSAINDLQLIAKSGKITVEDVGITSHRDTMMMDEDIIVNVINSLSIEEGLSYLRMSSLPYERLLRGIADTLFRNGITADCMEVIIKADNILSHIRKNSDYKLVRYFFQHLAAVGVYREDEDAVMETAKPVWVSRRKESNGVIEKFRKAFPMSADKIYSEIIPAVKYAGNTPLIADFMENLGISQKELFSQKM